MVPLEKNFIKSGWHFEQLKRDGQVAIYKRTNIRFPKVIYWETVKIITQGEKVTCIAGNVVEFASQEIYPSSEQFGQFGKCCMTKEKAEQYYWEFAVGQNVGQSISSDSMSPLI
jgi:hypothetical protein